MIKFLSLAIFSIVSLLFLHKGFNQRKPFIANPISIWSIVWNYVFILFTRQLLTETINPKSNLPNFSYLIWTFTELFYWLTFLTSAIIKSPIQRNSLIFWTSYSVFLLYMSCSLTELRCREAWFIPYISRIHFLFIISITFPMTTSPTWDLYHSFKGLMVRIWPTGFTKPVSEA